MINWTVESRKLSEIKPYEKNPRRITEKNLNDLIKSLGLSCLFVDLSQGLSILSFPRDESVGAPAVYDDRRRRWTGKLGIFREDQESVSLDERAIGSKLFALGYDVRIIVGRWALLQDSGGAVEYDEAICGALSSCLGSLDAAEEHPTWLSVRGGLSNRCENVGAENRKELSNAS